MKRALILLPALLTACAAASDVPSLLPRPIEQQVANPPAVPEPQPPAPADAALQATIAATLNRARAAEAAFRREEPGATRTIAAGRGAAAGSETWIAAELARSVLDSARADAVAALGELDTLLVARIDTNGTGIAELQAAQAEVDAIVGAQNERLAALSR